MEFCSENLQETTTTTATEGIEDNEGIIISESEEATESRVTASGSTSESKGELRRLQHNPNHKKSETQDFNKQHTKHTTKQQQRPTSRRVVVKKRTRGNKNPHQIFLCL